MKFAWVVFFFLFVGAAGTSLVFYNQLKHSNREVRTLSIDPKVLEAKLAKEPPEWMTRQIQKDLAVYSSGITKKMIDDAFHGGRVEEFNLVRFTIQDGHISFS